MSVSKCKMLVLLFVATATALPMHEQTATVNVQLVRQHDHPRHRRDICESEMPDVIVTNFTFLGDDVILRLYRVPLLPMMVADDENSLEFEDISDDSAVYVDPSKLASIMVKKSGVGDFLLDGNLKHMGKQLTVTPSDRQKRAANNPHTVTTVTPRISFGDDALPGEDEINLPRGQGRQATGVHTVETVFVVDYRDYRNWQTRFPTNTLTNLREFYTYTAQSVNNIFTSVKLMNSALDIKFVVKQLYVITNPTNSFSEVLNTTTNGGPIDGSVFLNTLRDWIPTQSANGLDQTADHYMSFTAYDIILNGVLAVVGVAKKGVVCKVNSVSVVENSFKPSVANIAAHELGHSLDASHDGETGVPCSEFSQYVMTPTLFARPQYAEAQPQNLFDFSSCSVSAFASYLNTVSCTLPAQTQATNALPAIPYGNIVTDLNAQCRYIRNDPTSERCTYGHTLDQICFGMQCRIPSSEPNLIKCTYVLPFEGTPCGTGLVCSQGACVNLTTTSVLTTTTTTMAPTTTKTTMAPTTTTTMAPTTTTTRAPTTTTTTMAPTTTTTRAPTTTTTTMAPTTTTTMAPTTTTMRAPTTTTTTMAPTTTSTRAPTTTMTTMAPTTTTTRAQTTTTTTRAPITTTTHPTTTTTRTTSQPATLDTRTPTTTTLTPTTTDPRKIPNWCTYSYIVDCIRRWFYYGIWGSSCGTCYSLLFG